MPAQFVALLFRVALVVGGMGLGTGGVGYTTGCGNSMMLPVTCPEVPVQAVTLLEVQVPVPVRGVERLPLIVVGLPEVERFPLVPTFPEESDIVGVPLPP